MLLLDVKRTLFFASPYFYFVIFILSLSPLLAWGGGVTHFHLGAYQQLDHNLGFSFLSIVPLQGRALCLHKALLLITPFSQHCFHFRQCTGRSPDNIYWPGNWSMLSSHACSNSTTSPSVQYAMMLPWSLQCSSYRFLSLLVNLQSNTNHWMELCTRWRNTSAIKQKQHEDLPMGRFGTSRIYLLWKAKWS